MTKRIATKKIKAWSL